MSLGVGNDGKPIDKSYLEVGLPTHLRKAIDDFLQGEKDDVSYLDCLSDEVYGSINSSKWDGEITEEQATYLFSKYCFGDDDDD